MIAVSFSVSRIFLRVVAHQELGRRLESVGADLEDRILALLVLAQMRPDAGEQHAEAERLGDIVIGAGIEAEDGVGIRCLRGQHDDRPLVAVAPHDLAGLAPVHVGQVDVEEDEVGAIVLERLDARVGVRGIADGEFAHAARIAP